TPVVRAMHLFRPHGIPMPHHLRARLHRGALLVVDVDATLWHSELSWCVAWTAGGMVERPPPPAGGPATAWPLAVATRWSAGEAPWGQGPPEVLMSSPRGHVYEISPGSCCLNDPGSSGHICALRRHVAGREVVGSPVSHHDLRGSPDHHPRGSGSDSRLRAWVRGQDWGRYGACARLFPGRRRGR